nr:hypothetical protein [Tanacetum cinerariifolium]
MMVQSQLGKGSTMPTDPQHTPILLQPSISQPQKTQKYKKPRRKDTQVPQLSGPTESVKDEAIYKELGNSLVKAATTASSLEAECQDTVGDTTAQTRSERVFKFSNDSLLARGNEINSLKRRVKKLEKKQRSRTHKLKGLYKGKISDIDADEGITLVSTHDDAKMFDVDQDLHGGEVLVAKQDENVGEKEVDDAQVQVNTTATTPIISIDDVTLA